MERTNITLIQLVDAKKIVLCITPNTLLELSRVLAYPKFEKTLRRMNVSIHEVITYVLEHALLFEDISLVAPIIEDPSDNMFINCALVSRSQWIVSGDQHLLQLKEFASIQIVTPKEFLEKM